MATLALQQVTDVGLAPAMTAATNGDRVPLDPTTWLEVLNGSGASINVTVTNEGVDEYGHDTDLVVAVPAGASRKIRLSPSRRYANPTDGMATLNYSATTTVTVGAFRF